MSLARRVTLLVVAVSVASSLLTFLVVVGLAREATREAAVASVGRDADLLARVVRGAGGVAGPGLAVEALQGALEARSVRTAIVASGTAPPAAGGEPWTPADLEAAAAGSPVSDLRRVDGRRWIVEARPAGRYAVVVAQPFDVATSFVPPPRRRAAIAAAAGALTGAVVGLVVARGLSRPLVRLDAAARRLAAGEREVRVEPGGGREIAGVAEALNGLSSALATSEERQRRFLLTVSHELRTPLTAVTGYAEALADGALPAAEIPRAGHVMRQEAARLQRRVEELLALARLEADDVTVDPERVDAVALARAAHEAWGPRARAAGVPLLLDVPVAGSTPAARADAERLRQAVDALVDNALRIVSAGAGEGGTPAAVVVAARPLDGRVAVEVRDGGPGLADAELAAAFEPGLLTERYRGVRPVGSGVGLALVGRLARLMGGEAVASRAPEGGLAVTLLLPPDAPPGAAAEC